MQRPSRRRTVATPTDAGRQPELGAPWMRRSGGSTGSAGTSVDLAASTGRRPSGSSIDRRRRRRPPADAAGQPLGEVLVLVGSDE